MHLAEIEAIVAKKIRWIREKIHFQQQQGKPPERVYVSGEWFDFLGGKYQLDVSYASGQNRVKVAGGKINLRLSNSKASIKKILTEWYRQQADSDLRQRVAHYAPMIGVQPTAISVKTYKARWGTCYADGRISFNWKLVMAAGWVVDYVVVHELCHLVHHNHSAHFWHLVGRYCPEYQAAKDWLKQHGPLLEL